MYNDCAIDPLNVYGRLISHLILLIVILRYHYLQFLLLFTEIFTLILLTRFAWKANHFGLQSWNIIKKRLQHSCFPVNIAKCLRTHVLRNICIRPLLNWLYSRWLSWTGQSVSKPSWLWNNAKIRATFKPQF